MNLKDFLLIPTEEKNSIETLQLDLAELLQADGETWNLFLTELKQVKLVGQLKLTGSIEFNVDVQIRLKTLFFILFNHVKIQYIQLDRAMFNNMPKDLQQMYAHHIIFIQDKPPTSISADAVIEAYNNDNKGLFIRQTTAKQFVSDDWLSIIDTEPKTRLLSATFVLNDVPIALIGQVPSASNNKWKYTSGILYSQQTECHFAGKSDMNTDLYYLIRTGSFTYKINEAMLTPTGEVDYNKLYESNGFLRQYGAKVKKNVEELRYKVLEQRQRIKSGQALYKTTSGKTKDNIEKLSVENHGVLINNEALLAARQQDIIGVFINCESGAGIDEALNMQDFLAHQGIQVGLFTYDPKRNPGLIATTREEVMQNPRSLNESAGYTLSKTKLPGGSLNNTDDTNTTYKFYPYYLTESYQEYFSNLDTVANTKDGTLTFKLSASNLLKYHIKQFETISTINTLAHDYGWLKSLQSLIPADNCLKITAYNKDDLFIQAFIKRFFNQYQWSLQPVENKFLYQIDVGVDEALKIISSNTAKSTAYYLCIENASQEFITKAQAIQNTLSSVEVPAIIPWESLPFIEVNQQGIFLNFAFFYNQYETMQREHFIYSQYRDYYETIANKLKDLNILIPDNMYGFHIHPIIDTEKPEAHNDYVESLYAASSAVQPLTINQDLIQQQINTAFQALLKNYTCALVKGTSAGIYYLQFPNHVSDDESRTLFYQLQATIGLDGEFYPSETEEEADIVLRPAEIYISSILEFSKLLDAFSKHLELMIQKHAKENQPEPESDEDMPPLSPSSSPTNSMGFFANEFTLNQAMIDTLNALNGLLTREHLQEWVPYAAEASFTQSHGDAIIHLINDKKLSPQQAVSKTSHLTESEVREQFLLEARGDGMELFD